MLSFFLFGSFWFLLGWGFGYVLVGSGLLVDVVVGLVFFDVFVVVFFFFVFVFLVVGELLVCLDFGSCLEVGLVWGSWVVVGFSFLLGVGIMVLLVFVIVLGVMLGMVISIFVLCGVICLCWYMYFKKGLLLWD